MPKPNACLLALIVVSLFTWLSSSGLCEKTKKKVAAHVPAESRVTRAMTRIMQTKANEAKLFIAKHNYNSSICFLIDMSVPSGQNRFFVYDLINDSVQRSGLVAHGNCNQDWLNGRKYENTVGCGCTSLGKYKVGNPYTGRFGLAFKLY